MSDSQVAQSDVVAGLTAALEQFEAAVVGLEDAELDKSMGPGEWTIRQILHHLVDDGDFWALPIKKALASPGARLSFEGMMETDEWMRALDYEQRPVGAALALVRAQAAYWLELAGHFSGNLERFVKWYSSKGPFKQDLTARDMVSMLAEHLAEHAATISAIRGRS